MAVIDCLEDPDETLKRKTVKIITFQSSLALPNTYFLLLVGSSVPYDECSECGVHC